MRFDWRNYVEVGKDHASLVGKFEYLQAEGLDGYAAEVLKILSLSKLPARNAVNIIEQIIPESLNDWNRKEKQQCYYIANAVCFLKIMRGMFNADFIERMKGYTPNGEDDLLISNYHSLLEHLLLDSIYLLVLCDRELLGRRPRYGLAKSESKHPVTLYWSLQQLIFGQASFHCRATLGADGATAFIRQVIELRIRRAFGIFHLLNHTDGIRKKISMTEIFGILKEHLDEIEFTVPLHTIKRIYAWSNIFVHAGMRDLIWKPIAVAAFISSMIQGRRTRAGYDAHSGIALKASTLKKIRQEASRLKGEGYRLVGCEPEVVIR